VKSELHPKSLCVCDQVSLATFYYCSLQRTAVTKSIWSCLARYTAADTAAGKTWPGRLGNVLPLPYSTNAYD